MLSQPVYPGSLFSAVSELSCSNMFAPSELVLLMVLLTSAGAMYCNSPATLSIHSYINKTGQWTAKVNLEHVKTSGPWVVTTNVCEVGEMVHVSAILSRGREQGAGGSGKVPAGYVHFPGVGHYKFHPNGTTWPNARVICADEGAHLAIINSEVEADVMAQLFARHPPNLIQAANNNDWAWVGAHEMGVDGEYYTVFGEPLASTGFERWVKGQPDDTAVDTAVVTNRHSGGLGDAFPAWTASFICEL